MCKCVRTINTRVVLYVRRAHTWPRDAGEEGVRLDVGGAVLGADALALVLGEELQDQAFARGRDGRLVWEYDGLLQDVAERCAAVGALERRPAKLEAANVKNHGLA